MNPIIIHKYLRKKKQNVVIMNHSKTNLTCQCSISYDPWTNFPMNANRRPEIILNVLLHLIGIPKRRKAKSATIKRCHVLPFQQSETWFILGVRRRVWFHKFLERTAFVLFYSWQEKNVGAQFFTTSSAFMKSFRLRNTWSSKSNCWSSFEFWPRKNVNKLISGCL